MAQKHNDSINRGMKTIIKRGIVLIIAFSYLYSISFAFLPFNFPFVLGVVGCLLFVLNIKDRIMYRKNINYLLKISCLPLAVSVFSILINATFELGFTKLLITNIFYLFGAYLLVKMIKWGNGGRLDSTTIINYFIISAIIQCILTMIMFLNPSIANSLQSLLQYNEIAVQSLDRTDGTRLVGFGAYFFSSGVIHGFVLFLIVIQLFYRKQNSALSISLYLLCWIFIVIVGVMLARTTFIGAAGSIVLLLFILLFKKTTIPKSKIYLGFLFLLISCVIVMERLDKFSFLDDYEGIMHFGFEMFYNYDKTGSFSTSSSNGMLENMLIFPDNMATWLMGDGRWVDPNNPLKYYMHTDVGYSRMLFHFGLFGLFLFLAFQYKMINYSIKNAGYSNLYVLTFYVFMLILNIKGFTDLFLYLVPFAFIKNSSITSQQLIDNEKTRNLVK